MSNQLPVHKQIEIRAPLFNVSGSRGSRTLHSLNNPGLVFYFWGFAVSLRILLELKTHPRHSQRHAAKMSAILARVQYNADVSQNSCCIHHY
jgi:hypothetical protein